MSKPPTNLGDMLRRENGEKVMGDALKLLEIAAGHFDGGRPNQAQGYNLAAQQILDAWCNEYCYGPDRAARAARLPENAEVLHDLRRQGQADVPPVNPDALPQAGLFQPTLATQSRQQGS